MEKTILKNLPELYAGRAEEIRNMLQMELTPQFNERFSSETLCGEKIPEHRNTVHIFRQA